MTEADNHRRWAADRLGAYEVWYTTWNHPGTDQGFWLRFIIEAPFQDPARGELWFARFDPAAPRQPLLRSGLEAGPSGQETGAPGSMTRGPARPDRTFGIHRRFADVTATGGDGAPFGLTIGGARLGHDHSVGQLAGAGHDVRWDLRWEPAARALRLLPDVMYARGGLGETTVVSPNPRVPLSGTLVIDGEQLAFDRAIAGQTHLWGTKHAYAWTWGRCAEFTGAPGCLLELLGVRLQRRGVLLPPMTLVALDLDGEHHRFTQFRHVTANRATWTTGHVTFSAWSPTVRLEGELRCSVDQLVNAPYLDPDGTEVFCANTEIGDARVVVYRRSGLRWREHRRLVATHRAHFETGGRVRDDQVTHRHTLVP